MGQKAINYGNELGFYSTNPVTGQVVERYRGVSLSEASHILQQIGKSQHKWERTPLIAKSDLVYKLSHHLKRNIEKYSILITLEMGKPIAEAEAEIEKCAWLCEYYAAKADEFLKSRDREFAHSHSTVSFEPLGTVMGIMPWNFPFWQVLRSAIPSLLVGNTYVLKHSSLVPGCSVALERAFQSAGFPFGVFTSLLLRSENVESLIKSDEIVAVSVTGSEATGRKVARTCGGEIKKCVLELGGNDPYLVLEDADVELAAQKCVASRLINSGQSCIAAKRWIVSAEVYDDFLSAATSLIKGKVLGDPMERLTDVGPLAASRLKTTLQDQVENSIKLGARSHFKSEIPSEGFYAPIEILTNVSPGQPAFDDELFGPVATITTFTKEKQAVELANQSRFGLGAAIFSRDVERVQTHMAACLLVGTVAINDFVKSDPRQPFGGVKKSGFGRELADFGMYEFANIKSVVATNR